METRKFDGFNFMQLSSRDIVSFCQYHDYHLHVAAAAESADSHVNSRACDKEGCDGAMLLVDLASSPLPVACRGLREST